MRRRQCGCFAGQVVEDIESRGREVTVQAGIRLHDLNSQLENLGLALVNMGATCQQSIAGATQTGTHGTGRLLGSMSTQIIGMRLLLANGTFVDMFKGGKNSDLLASAAVGLGALGIVTRITLQTEKLFFLNLTKTIMPLDTLLGALPTLMERYERLQWYWNPPNEMEATLITREVVDRIPPGSIGCWEASNAEAHMGEPPKFFGVTSSMSNASSSTCIDVSYKALCGSRTHYENRNLYTEMEMFVPVERVASLISEFRTFQHKVAPLHNKTVPLFTGVRYVKGDSITLSPQTGGRDNAVVSFIVTGSSKTQTGSPLEFARYAQMLEALAGAYNGRPHWGKMNWANATSIRDAYGEQVAVFRDAHNRLDPHRRFSNKYLDSRLYDS